MSKIKTFLTTYKYGISATIALGLLLLAIIIYYTKCTPNIVTPSIQVPTKEIVKEQKQTEQLLLIKLDSLQQREKEIATRNIVLENMLYSSQLRNKELAAKKEKVFSYIRKDTGLKRDTVYQSLDEYAQDLIAGANNSDSLCNEVVTGLTKVIENKDSQSVVQQLKYAALKNSFDQAIQNDFQNQAAIKSLNRKLKWQKVKSNAGLVLLVGAAVKIFVK